jgi:hypothetical protein
MSVKLQPNQLLQQQIKGRFLPISMHSRSEIALTFNAVDQQTQQPVILKYYQGHSHHDIQDSIQRGVMSHAQLRSQQVVPIIDFGIHSSYGGVWCVQQQQAHHNLTRFVRSKSKLDSYTVCQILLSLSDALYILHKDKKVHGNLKPNNVFISMANDTPQTLISDVLGAGITGVHKKSSGRFTYNDPSFFTYEQASGKEIGLQTDIGVLGLLGYFMLTGNMPFEGRTTDKVLTSVIIGSGRLKLKTNEITGDAKQVNQLARIVTECLAKQMTARPKDLDTLAQALRFALESGAPTESAQQQGIGGYSSSNLMNQANSLQSPLTSTISGPPTMIPNSFVSQTIGFDAITDEMLNQFQSAQNSSSVEHVLAPSASVSDLQINTPSTRATSSTLQPKVMIPEPPPEWIEHVKNERNSQSDDLDISLLDQDESVSSSLIAPLFTPTPHTSTLHGILPIQSTTSTVLGTPKIDLPNIDGSRFTPHEPTPSEQNVVVQESRSSHALSSSDQISGSVSTEGDHSLSLEGGWGDMSSWGGLEDNPQNIKSSETPLDIADLSFHDLNINDTEKPLSIDAPHDEEGHTLLVPSGSSTLPNISDLMEGIELDSMGSESGDEVVGPEEQTLFVSVNSLSPESTQASEDSRKIDFAHVDDLDLDVLFEQAAQDLLQDQGEVSQVNQMVGETTLHIDREIRKVAEELDRIAEGPTSLSSSGERFSPETNSDDLGSDRHAGHHTEAQDDVINVDPQSAMSMILNTPDMSDDSIPEFTALKEIKDIEIGGAGASVGAANQQAYFDIQQELASPSSGRDHFETQIENTQLEHQKLEESFPDVPAWRSLIALKDQPEQLNQALLSISLPLSGQLLPFSQFQLEISSKEREEGFFVPAPMIPIPHIPVVSHLIEQDDLSNNVSGLWSGVHTPALSSPAVSTPSIQVGKPISQTQSSHPVINVVIFIATIAFIGGGVMFMNGMNLSDLSILIGLEGTPEVNQTLKPLQRPLQPTRIQKSSAPEALEINSNPSNPSKTPNSIEKPAQDRSPDSRPKPGLKSSSPKLPKTSSTSNKRRGKRPSKKASNISRKNKTKPRKEKTNSRKERRRKRKSKNSPLKDVF